VVADFLKISIVYTKISIVQPSEKIKIDHVRFFSTR
jgi:hypothetical protein